MEYVIALSNPNRPHPSNHFGSMIAQFSSTTLLLLTLFIVARFVKSVMAYCLHYSLIHYIQHNSSQQTPPKRQTPFPTTNYTTRSASREPACRSRSPSPHNPFVSLLSPSLTSCPSLATAPDSHSPRTPPSPPRNYRRPRRCSFRSRASPRAPTPSAPPAACRSGGTCSCWR